jgi:hypothetical protein
MQGSSLEKKEDGSMNKMQWLGLAFSVGGAVGATCAVCALAGAGMAGCSSSSAGGAAPQPDAAAPGPDTGTEDAETPVVDAAGDAGDAGAKVVTLTWQVAAQLPPLGSGGADAGAAQPIAGAKVCVNAVPSIACVTTDAQGSFMLPGLPAVGDVVVTIDAAGYRSVALAVATMGASVAGTIGPIVMPSASAPDPAIGATVDWANKGQVEFFALGPGALVPDGGAEGVPGATVTFAPMSGVGPVFVTDQNTFDASAPSLIDAIGAVYNVDPGNYSLTIDAPANDCESISFPLTGYGYPGAAHQVKFPVLKGYTTFVGEYCAAIATIGGPDATADGAADN